VENKKIKSVEWVGKDMHIETTDGEQVILKNAVISARHDGIESSDGLIVERFKFELVKLEMPMFKKASFTIGDQTIDAKICPHLPIDYFSVELDLGKTPAMSDDHPLRKSLKDE